jgi:hypothetical protein
MSGLYRAKETAVNFRRYAKTLAMGSMLALAVVGLPAVQAQAKSKTGPYWDYCTITDPKTGEITFYRPGERVLRNGIILQCRDGKWVIQENRTSTLGSPTAPQTVGLAP